MPPHFGEFSSPTFYHLPRTSMWTTCLNCRFVFSGKTEFRTQIGSTPLLGLMAQSQQSTKWVDVNSDKQTNCQTPTWLTLQYFHISAENWFFLNWTETLHARIQQIALIICRLWEQRSMQHQQDEFKIIHLLKRFPLEENGFLCYHFCTLGPHNPSHNPPNSFDAD